MRGERIAFLKEESMNEEGRKVKVEDSHIFLGGLENFLKGLREERALREEIIHHIALLKSQTEPLKELPERLSHWMLFRIGFMKTMAIKVLNFLNREERKNALAVAESLELIISYIETKRDGK